MTQHESNGKKLTTAEGEREARGASVFAVFDFVIKAVVVTLVVLGIMLVIIALSGVQMEDADGHEIFRYRMHAAAALIVGYLLIDVLMSRRRARQAANDLARTKSANASSQFELSIDPDADRRAVVADAAAKHATREIPKRSYTVVWMALAFVAAGGAAFWYDHVANKIPNAVAVPARFLSAKCVEARGGTKGVSVGAHMSIGYEFASRSTSVRTPEMQCLLANCEPETAPRQYPDTLYKQVFYSSVSACEVELPAILAAKAPTTVWTGDKAPNASVRARFTPEREKPPYFLLWFPSLIAAIVLLISALKRRRRARGNAEIV